MASRRKGRGSGSGLGKTAGRGHKGQRARSGGGVRPGFEGGQMPLYRRVPKRGFRNVFKKEIQIVNLEQLSGLPPEIAEIDPRVLQEAGLISDREGRVKILGKGNVDRAMTIKGHGFSSAAKEKILKAGGAVEELTFG